MFVFPLIFQICLVFICHLPFWNPLCRCNTTHSPTKTNKQICNLQVWHLFFHKILWHYNFWKLELEFPKVLPYLAVWWCPGDIWEKRRTSSFSSRGPAASPQGISRRKGKGELLGREVSLSKHYPCWHVHFMTSDKEINGFCPLTISHTLQPLPVLLFSCSPPSLENFQSFQVSPPNPLHKQRKHSDPTMPLFSPQPLLVTLCHIQTATSWLANKCYIFASLQRQVLHEQMAEGSGLWGTACLPECNGNFLCRESALNTTMYILSWTF